MNEQAETQAPGSPDEERVRQTLGLEQPRGLRKKRLLPAFAVVAAALVAALVLNRSEDRWDYATAKARSGDLVESVTAVGRLEPRNAVDVSSELSGIVARVFVDVNDRVRAGDKLAELDTALLRSQALQARAQVGAAEAGVRQAEAVLRAADRELERIDGLRDGMISDALREQVATAAEQARAGLDVARAQLAQAQAAHRASRTNLEKSVLLSPIDGVVLTRNVEPGQAVVSALQAAILFRVAEDLSRMRVELDVDEAEIGRVRAGQTADFTVAAYPERLFDGVVHKVHVAPSLSLQVVTYKAVLHVDNDDGVLLPGMTVTARIITETHRAKLLIPSEALRFQPPEEFLEEERAEQDDELPSRIWVLEDGVPRAMAVRTSVSDGTRLAVDAGELEAGMPVITSATERRRNRSK